MLSGIRDQMEVKDDAEWAIISDRINAIFSLRRTMMPMGMGFPGFGGQRNNRQNTQADPSVEALRTAITDHLPDAEIKARLDRFREVQKQNEAKLEQARDSLRSVLTLRQEAVAVSMGLLN